MSSPRLALALLLQVAPLLASLLAPLPALAADLDRYPPPSPYDDGDDRPPPPPVPAPAPALRVGPGPGWVGGGCRSFVRRRLDADGAPVIRRVQVCEEPDGFEGPPREHRDGFPPPGFRRGPPPGPPWARDWAPPRAPGW